MMDPKEREIRNQVSSILRIQGFNRRFLPREAALLGEMAALFDSDTPLSELPYEDGVPEDRYREQAKAELAVELSTMFEEFMDRFKNL